MPSVVIDQDDVWFFLYYHRFMIGKLQLHESTATVQIYIVGDPYTGFNFQSSRNDGIHRLNGKHVDEHIKAVYPVNGYG
jgi:hypothetical protein